MGDGYKYIPTESADIWERLGKPIDNNELIHYNNFKLGYENWTLNWVPRSSLPDCEGFTDYASRSTTIAQDAHPASRAGTTLHELLHALWASWGLPEKDEECIVSTLSNGLASLIQDNQKLFEVILRDLRK